MGGSILFLVVGGIVGVFAVLVFVAIYNGLVGKKNAVEQAFSGIDTSLKKRYDLIPNLVETVKNYMQHERETLTQLTELRSKALSGGLSAAERVDVDNQITRGISGIMVSVESYPDLKANQNFLQLQDSLTKIEGEISGARKAFNQTTTEYNNSVETIPSNLVAMVVGYKRRPLFEITEAERKNVDVGQLFKR